MAICTGIRALFIVTFTVCAVGSGVLATAAAVLFQREIRLLDENYRGAMVSQTEPCVRNTLPSCSNAEFEYCLDDPPCCPQRSFGKSDGDNLYECMMSPVVGIYCQHSTIFCGGPKCTPNCLTAEVALPAEAPEDVSTTAAQQDGQARI